MLMERRAPDASGSCLLAVRKMIGIEQTQRFFRPLINIGLVAHERLHPANINIRQIKRRMAMLHPMGQRHAGATGGLDANGIKPGADEIILQFGRFAKMIGIIGRKTFRPVEEGVNARRFQHRHAVDRIFQNRFEMIEILRQLIKAEIFGNPFALLSRDGQGLETGSKAPKQDLAGIFLVIGTFIRHPQHRQLFQALNVLGDNVEMFASLKRNIDTGHAAQFMGPHAAAIDHIVGLNCARVHQSRHAARKRR